MYLTLFGIGFAFYTAKRVGRWPNYTTGEFYDLPQLRYNVRRGRVETAQVYQFDHVGQGPNETYSVIIDNL